jgi:glyoxylase-like metal-dependent hydrolase (beta-lactamase superfamily II)
MFNSVSRSSPKLYKLVTLRKRAFSTKKSEKAPIVTKFFHQQTNSFSYVVTDPATKDCVVIDPVLDYEQASGTISTSFAKQIVEYIKEHNLDTKWIFETHVHADHLTSAQYLKEKLGGAIAISEGVKSVQKHFKQVFNFKEFKADGSQFDHLIKNNDQFSFGKMKIRALHTPGHTPSCITYHIGDTVFVGDTLFMPDFGTARCDFPGGNAKTLYKSVTEKIYSLPADTRMFMCHDYAHGGREIAWETSVGEQKKNNKHIQENTTEEEFVKMRTERDKRLSAPNLLFPAIQFNMNGGKLFHKEDNGVHYFKLPLNSFKTE